MKQTTTCRHCNAKIAVDLCDVDYIFCDECEQKFRNGTLRVCDCCGTSWEVEQGDCGYSVIYPTVKDTTAELCKACEINYKKIGAEIFMKGESNV